MNNLLNLTDENLLSLKADTEIESDIYETLIKRHKSTVEIIASK